MAFSRQQTELLNSEGTHLFVHAVKISEVPFSAPQQSDYLVDWDRKAQSDGALKGFLRTRLSPDQIGRISNFLNRLRVMRAVWKWKRNSRLSNRRFYIPVSDWTQTTHEAFERS
jgi:hypothetical protein